LVEKLQENPQIQPNPLESQPNKEKSDSATLLHTKMLVLLLDMSIN
jgi:hypothetical protein